MGRGRGSLDVVRTSHAPNRHLRAQDEQPDPSSASVGLLPDARSVLRIFGVLVYAAGDVGDALSQAEREYELKQVIVETLQLRDVTADTIDSEAPLFGSGLSLDSVDGIELALGIERHFGVKIDPSAESVTEIFGSVRALAEHLAAHGAWPSPEQS